MFIHIIVIKKLKGDNGNAIVAFLIHIKENKFLVYKIRVIAVHNFVSKKRNVDK